MQGSSHFQSIIYALIARSSDGLPLSATTDFTDELNKDIKQCKKYLKVISKKANQFPERCMLSLPLYTIYCITHLGVTFLVLCVATYPTVLAFSFLNELMKEFIVNYEINTISRSVRPYCFMEFDNFMHKTCQRYNKPQSLTTRVNLSELSLEVKLRPPYEINIEEVEPPVNGYMKDRDLPFLATHKLQFEDLSLISFMTMCMSILLILTSIFRGVSTLSEFTYEEVKSMVGTHGIDFLADGICRSFQVYLLVRQVRNRKLKSWLNLFVLLFFDLQTVRVQNDWQTILSISTSIIMHISIIFRRIQSKLPDYQV